MIHPILFASSLLEARFRRAVERNWQEEMGGWFIMNASTPVNWRGFRSGEVGKAIGGCWFDLIDGLIVVPNAQKDKAHTFSPWDDDKARALAHETARAMGGWALAWHTHPDQNPEPSKADIAHHAHFDGSVCEFCIVTPHPLRIWPYTLEVGGFQSTSGNYRMECGEFVSWRRKVMAQFR